MNFHILRSQFYLSLTSSRSKLCQEYLKRHVCHFPWPKVYGHLQNTVICDYFMTMNIYLHSFSIQLSKWFQIFAASFWLHSVTTAPNLKHIVHQCRSHAVWGLRPEKTKRHHMSTATIQNKYLTYKPSFNRASNERAKFIHDECSAIDVHDGTTNMKFLC